MMAVMAVVVFSASAQVEKGLRYGIVLSGSMSHYSDPQNNGTGNTFGFGIGCDVEYNFSPNFYLDAALEFGLRGTKMDKVVQNSTTIMLESPLRSYNLIVPINVGGRVNVSDNVAIFAQAGPYVSYAFKPAEIKADYGSLGSVSMKGESFDYGFNGKLGVEFKQFQVFGGYEFGLNNVWRYLEGKNRSIVFGLGYKF